MNVEQAISSVIKSYGMEILSYKNRFQSMVRDYAAECDNELRLFNVCCQYGLLDIAQEIVAMKDERKIESVVKKAKIRLKKNAFMTEEHAVKGINMILQGIGISYKLIADSATDCKSQFYESNRGDSIQDRFDSEYITQISCNKKVKIDKKLFEDLRRDAENGDKNAMISVGDFYKNGIIVEQNWRMAEYYYRKAAELESEEARYKHIQLINENLI